MNVRAPGDFDYDGGGGGYAAARRPIRASPPWSTPRSARHGPSSTSAPAGSYEPEDRASPPSSRPRLREMRRVSRGPVVVLTFDGDALDLLWLADYMPELITAERRRYPAIGHIRDVLGGASTVAPVPVPADCVDGLTEAYFARPERFMDPAVRHAQSAWGFVEEAAIERGVTRLRADLDSGAWDRRYGTLRTQPEFTGSLRLIIAQPG